MTRKDDYTTEEWNEISSAPFLAGLYISTADPSGLIGMSKEAMAVSKAIAKSAADSKLEIVGSLADSIKAGGFSARPKLPELPKRDLTKARQLMGEHLKKATEVVAAKSPEEAEAYKKWLMDAAHSVAAASKEGGFFGFGGKDVSAEEQAALTELKAKLGRT